jgi:gamma-glutamyltranspeptidase/glutathione hydrolase
VLALLGLATGLLGSLVHAAEPANGTQGMVAANHPLASLAGIQVLVDGGNAVDAAIAAAAALGVVEPDASGLGGDGFMMIRWAEDDSIHALNFSGRAPMAASIEAFPELDDTPMSGPAAAVVPGAAAGWNAALDRFGSLPVDRILAPAIAYAENGYVADAATADTHAWAIASFLEWGEIGARTWWGGGIEPPAVGQLVRNPNLAATYRTLAEEGLDAFYRGDLAARIAAAVQEHGGLMSVDDLAAYRPRWDEPLRGAYRGFDVHTVAPNASGGLAAIEILHLLEGFDLASMDALGAETVHLFVEAAKLAAADRAVWAVDPAFVDDIPLDRLTSRTYADERRAEIDRDRAATDVEAGVPQPGTTHLTVVDRFGNVVSMTSSLGFGWGSGFVAGDTGVVLNNAMHMFDLDPESPMLVEGGKRPRWNMAPMIVEHDGSPILAIGTPGGTAIWQVLPQVLSRIFDHGMTLQAAIDAPRVSWRLSGPAIALEDRFDESTLEALAAKGHEPSAYTEWSVSMGGVNAIWIDPDDGRLVGASDPRRSGYVLGW